MTISVLKHVFQCWEKLGKCWLNTCQIVGYDVYHSALKAVRDTNFANCMTEGTGHKWRSIWSTLSKYLKLLIYIISMDSICLLYILISYSCIKCVHVDALAYTKYKNIFIF